MQEAFMITRRYDISDKQWNRIRNFLPGQKESVGRSSPDTGLFVNAVVWRYRTGAPWRDVPEFFGDFRNIHKRYRRWCLKGLWKRVFDELAREADDGYAEIDATIAKAHQHSAGATGSEKKKSVSENPKGD